jgi:hypothetical protein
MHVLATFARRWAHTNTLALHKNVMNDLKCIVPSDTHKQTHTENVETFLPFIALKKVNNGTVVALDVLLLHILAQEAQGPSRSSCKNIGSALVKHDFNSKKPQVIAVDEYVSSLFS